MLCLHSHLNDTQILMKNMFVDLLSSNIYIFITIVLHSCMILIYGMHELSLSRLSQLPKNLLPVCITVRLICGSLLLICTSSVCSKWHLIMSISMGHSGLFQVLFSRTKLLSSGCLFWDIPCPYTNEPEHILEIALQ